MRRRRGDPGMINPHWGMSVTNMPQISAIAFPTPGWSDACASCASDPVVKISILEIIIAGGRFLITGWADSNRHGNAGGGSTGRPLGTGCF